MSNTDLQQAREAAYACFAGGDLAAASARLRELRQRFGADAQSANDLGVVAFQLGRHREALDWFREAQALAGQEGDLLVDNLIGLLGELVQESPSRGFAPDDVVAGYEFILGRAPENARVIEEKLALGSRAALRRELLASPEFEASRKAGALPSTDPRALDPDTPRVVLLHLPKTGGTSLHRMLLPHFATEEVCPERWNGLGRIPFGEIAAYRYFSGHFDWASCQLLPGRRKRIITMLREPKARLVSLYWFQRAHQPDVIAAEGLDLAELAQRHDIVEFFSQPQVRAHCAIDNAMTRALAGRIQPGRWEAVTGWNDPMPVEPRSMLAGAIAHLDGLHAFGVLEDQALSIACLFERLELPAPARIEDANHLDEVMHSNPGLRSVERSDPGPALDEVLADLVRLDEPLWQHARARLRERMGARVS